VPSALAAGPSLSLLRLVDLWPQQNNTESGEKENKNQFARSLAIHFDIFVLSSVCGGEAEMLCATAIIKFAF
jgi:hypothetical protein